MKYVLLSLGFFLVQNVSSFSRVARYTPSLSCILTSKISSKSNKANLQNQPTYFAKLDIMCNFVYNIKSRLFC